MVNDLKQLLRENVADAPADHVDVAALVAQGRRRTRTRRTAFIGGTALLAAGAVVASLAVAGSGGTGVDASDGPPAPNAPTLRLADAQRAVEGHDYEVLGSLTIDDVDNAQRHVDGVTDDGLIVLRDGPRADQSWPRFALLDPATGDKDWLPKLDIGQTQTWPIELGTDRLVLLGSDGGLQGDLRAYVFDRDTRQWSGMKWPTLPVVDLPGGALGPDGRIYVPVPAATDQPGDGRSRELWSVSLTDVDDVRDEGLSVGDVAFTDSTMAWTDATDGAPGMVHVRDLATGDEHSFDPDAGEKCDLVHFGATDDRVVLGEACGTYADGVSDDRTQILTTDGDQVATLQDSGAVGTLAAGSDVVTVRVFGDPGDDRSGTYVYDLVTDEFLRISDTISSYGLGGTTGNDGQFLWHTPVDDGRGAKQWVGELR